MNSNDDLAKDIGQLKKEVALLNQFNVKVVEPRLADIANALRDTPTRTEFDKLETRVSVIEKDTDGTYVTRREVWAIVGTVGLTGTVLSIITIVLRLKG